MTGRSLHDALLRVLTSAERRRCLARGELPAGIGVEEAGVLRAADGERLGRLARFLGRHFYRERVVRLFAASRALAVRRGTDPLAVLEDPAFAALLDVAELGSAATADGVARLVERAVAPTLRDLPYAADLVAYEGVLFRAEAWPRAWTAAGAPEDGVPVRSPHARLCALDWDVTGLVAAVRRGDPLLPEPTRTPVRLLVSLARGGRVTTVRCPRPVEQLLGVLDGVRSPTRAAEAAGIPEDDAVRVLRQLTEVGAVEWQSPRGALGTDAAAPRPGAARADATSSPRSSSRASGTRSSPGRPSSP